MMATVLRKVKLGNRNKSDMVSRECDGDTGDRRGTGSGYSERESVVPCSRVCGLVNVCARPADSMGNCRRRNRPQRRRNTNSMTLFRSLQLRIDLWTSTTGNLLDRSFARRFCGRKCDNELYRSNSFRFEKFERQEEEDIQQQVSLCDDYSLPVDFVNKRRSRTLDWRSQGQRNQVEVVDEYFDPRDSKLRRGVRERVHTSGHSRRHHRHSTPIDPGSLGSAFRDHSNLRVTVFHPDSDNEEERVEIVERRPSPYYYSDLLNHDDSGPSAFKSYRKTDDNNVASQKAPVPAGLESYRPFSAKENFEHKQGGLGFYDFASGKVRKKNRVIEVKGNLSKKKQLIAEREREGEEEEEEEEEEEAAAAAEEKEVVVVEEKEDASVKEKLRGGRGECVKSSSLDGGENSPKRRECSKSLSLDIALEETSFEVGDSANRFRPIVPVKEIEEGIEGGDEEEEEVKREKRKSLRKVPQIYNFGYRDCLTGAPKRHLPKSDEFSPAEILQHVIHSGGDSKSLLAACLAEWDAHVRLMRPPAAQALSKCACSAGAQQHCISSDEDEDCQYSRNPVPLNFVSRGEFIRHRESLRRRDFFKEPIPDGENLGDEFIRGKKIVPEKPVEVKRKPSKKKVKKGLNANEIYNNWRIVVEDEGGFENWNQGYDENSDSAEAYRIAREIVKETEKSDGKTKPKNRKSACRSTESLYDPEDMSRRGLLYETAFDSKISRSDDDLDELDRVTNHPVLYSRIGRSKSATPAALIENYTKSPRPGSAFGRNREYPKEKKEKASEDEKIADVTDKMKRVDLSEKPTPPSTEPLPPKFSGHDDFSMNSTKSAPELPIASAARFRLENPRRPGGEVLAGVEKGDTVPENASKEAPFAKPKNLVKNDGLILEIKGRPPGNVGEKKMKMLQRPRSLIGEIRPVLDYGQRRPGRLKFSSTESMATSSSGGSLESIKSSTSEGNRSTSSSESHRSSSLSSHSSDSVGNVVAITAENLQFHLKQTSSHHHNQSSKIHILSPISDKSSVGPSSEVGDNNKNNNSQKASPEEPDQHSAKPDNKSKRRVLQNKNLLNLGLQMSSSSGEAQGSDSGISIESRTARSGGLSANQTETDFSDLPFDMPKLRRRRLAEQDANRRQLEVDACTSGSATSVDLRDLPFDMPKLRKRLRPPSLSESQASSSQSVADQSRGVLFRPSMTLSLDLESNNVPGRGLSLDLDRGRGTMTLGTFSGVDLIDPMLPLEKQTWYHGAITRVEAENLLRSLKEGSYLVRNSESARQDYSLSLKSARGFMHMRIQKDSSSGQYILGQFSNPFDSIPDMIRHYSINRLPIRGAEHMCLLKPVAAQLL